ncbi:hypothetical protein FORC88_1870 [Salmonella enterica subsp. enterica serovar Typhimurium]|nr:hypothetical protein SEEOR701_10654 [Salmonella enterica subsp. enterica serovar Oranienburg str. 701]QCK19020.1 hypothetical protein FORC88_1870 [Salmonella enterica subsp. enterica serovar Typhimurium]
MSIAFRTEQNVIVFAKLVMTNLLLEMEEHKDSIILLTEIL